VHIIVHRNYAFPICLLGVHRASDRLRLNEKLDDNALRILVHSGLEKRFPDECRQWKHHSNVVRSMSESRAGVEIVDVSARLRAELPTLQRSLFEVILDEVLRLYP